MKRDKFLITESGKQVGLKFAWNTAWHGISNLVANFALDELQSYSLVEADVTNRDDNCQPFAGFQVWQGEQNGKQLRFEIQKL
jgi:hypothetical protein